MGLLDIWNGIKIYLLHTILIAGIAYAIMPLPVIKSVQFAGVTFLSLLFIEKVFLHVFKLIPSTPTVREQLMKECPKQAGGTINPGNEATYDGYLFSGCEAAGTCDSHTPDEISNGILSKTEPCGAWDLKSTGLSYTPDKGWVKAQDCTAYGDDSAYLPDKCLENIWKASGCTNVQAADKQYTRWKKQTKKEVTRDINSWATLQDTTHRTLCYGPDRSKWPTAPAPVNCGTFTDGDKNLPAQCTEAMWAAAGCKTPAGKSATDWWANLTKAGVKADINQYATLGDDAHRTRCYGPDRTSWPRAPLTDCAALPLDSTNMPDDCLAQQWSASGCTNPAILQQPASTTWWKQQTKQGVINDMQAWATETDDMHRKMCYGPNRATWPAAAAPPPTDDFCKSKNPGTLNVKAVKTKCVAGGCNNALGSPGWIDFCNADNAEYTCCGNNTPPPKVLGSLSTWKQVNSGGLAQLSRDGNVLCTTGGNQTIWCADQNVDSIPNWVQIPGALTHVSVSNGRLYGVNAAGNIWFADSYKTGRWVQIPGGLKQVSLDGNTVCGIGGGDTIWCADQNIETGARWFQLPGGLKYISLKNGRLYGVNANNDIYYADNYKTGNWVNVPGKLTQVEYVDGNTVCGVGLNNDVYCADTNIETNPNWTRLPGALTQITGSGGKLSGVGTDAVAYAADEYVTPIPPPPLTSYTPLNNQDQDGQTIQEYTNNSTQCMIDCDKNTGCAGIVNNGPNCWTIKGFPSPYTRAGSVTYKKNSATGPMYTTVSGQDQDGQTIQAYRDNTQLQCKSDCDADKTCAGVITNGSNCWTVKGFPTPYANQNSVTYKKSPF